MRGTQEGSATLLVFGVLGVATGAFQWASSPWFTMLGQAAAEWLVENEWRVLLEGSAPWWLLTHQPQANEVRSWLDGLMILGWIGGHALLAGGSTWLLLRAAAWLVAIDWRPFAMALVPLAGVGLFLGLSMMTVRHLEAEGLPGLGAVGPLRVALLALGLGWSGWLAWRLVGGSAAARPRRLAGFALSTVPLMLGGGAWCQMLFAW